MKREISTMLLRNHWLIFILFLLFVACDESLPLRIVPQNTLEITRIIANQESGLGGIFIAIDINGVNGYSETFEDTVTVKGNVHIWWARKPEVQANVAVGNQHFKPPTRISGKVLTLDPGEEFRLETFWYLNTIDGRNIIDMLDFSNSPVVDGMVTAAPEKFILEIQLALFAETGLMHSKRHEFILKGWKLAEPSPPKRY
ncbi:hypothetical protein JW964_08165 [candidate division KSB1 bacterium]|nr:hypothetical protein [candidate division KSB1 bacterium]